MPRLPFQVFNLAGLFFFFFTTKARLSTICKAKQSQLIREDLFLDHNKVEILRLKKEKLFKAQFFFFSKYPNCQGLLLILCLHHSFLLHPFFSLSLLILTFISFSFLLFLYLNPPPLFSLFFSFFFFHAPYWKKGILSLINYLHIPLSFIHKICPLYNVDPFQYLSMPLVLRVTLSNHHLLIACS